MSFTGTSVLSPEGTLTPLAIASIADITPEEGGADLRATARALAMPGNPARALKTVRDLVAAIEDGDGYTAVTAARRLRSCRIGRWTLAHAVKLIARNRNDLVPAASVEAGELFRALNDLVDRNENEK